MAEKMIKHLLFTYGKLVDNPLYDEEAAPDQPKKVMQEGLGRLGEVIDVERPYDLARGEEFGAFFTDEERKAIEEGTYRGVDAPAVMEARLSQERAIITPIEGEGPAGDADVSTMSVEEVAGLIEDRKLNVQQTVDLAGEDPDDIEKVLDAESLATENEPRAGVTKGLEARLAKVTTG
jgi:hypothetical protein